LSAEVYVFTCQYNVLLTSIIQLTKTETNKCTQFVRITIMILHVNTYIFRALLAHHQGVHRCIRHTMNLFVISK